MEKSCNLSCSFLYPDGPHDILRSGEGSAKPGTRRPPWRSPQVPAISARTEALQQPGLWADQPPSPWLIMFTMYWRLRSQWTQPPRMGALTWVPGQSPHSHQGTEENKNSLWFCRLKIAPDIPVLCRETIYMLYITTKVWLQLQMGWSLKK